MDFLWALLFLVWYEALSLPLRCALATWPAPPDVRRMLSRLAGPALLALPIWFAAHGVGWALARGVGLAWLALALGVGLLTGLRRHRPRRLLGYEDHPSQRGGHGLGRELALDLAAVAVFLAFIAVRRWVPEMTMEIGASAAEKFPNAMIFWSNWHARALPPQDYWLAGNPLTYYYWGHFHWAWLARLGGFPPNLAINLSLAGAVLLSWEAAYLLARAAKLSLAWAAGAALTVTWGGNPAAIAGAITLFHNPGPLSWASYDFWAPSRAISNVVDEFPAFSAILGDFHSHHLALPWVTAWLALMLEGLRWPGLTDLHRWRRPAPDAPWHRAAGWGVVWITLALAAVLTNLWNLPLVGFAVAVMLLLTLRRGWRLFLPALGLTLALGVALWAGSRLLRAGAPLPLPTASATGFLDRLPIRPLPVALRSTLAELFGLWGLPALVLALGVVASAAHQLRRRSAGALKLLALTLAGGVMILLAVIFKPAADPQLQILQLPVNAQWLAHLGLPLGTLWAWGGLALWTLALMLGPRPWLPRRVGWMLLAALATLTALELIFLKDRFEGSLVRYNSYFKFSYPVWPAFFVAAWVVARRLWRVRLPGPLRLPLRAALALLLLATFVYTGFAVPARLLMARWGDNPPRQPSLDAFDFTRHRPPFDAEAPLLAWIRLHVPAGDVIAEAAPLEPYSYGGRIASLTGHPIPLGWPHHEQQWRGPVGYDLINARGAAIDQLYRSTTPALLRAQAQKLNVRWVVFGKPERERYGAAALQVFQRTARVAIAFPEFGPSYFLFDFNPNLME